MKTKTDIEIIFQRIVNYLLVILISGIVLYSCRRQISVTPPDAPPPSGFMYIDSYPKGFDIYLDGKDRRRITPDSLTWLSNGIYKITLKKDLFRDSSFTINILEGKKKSMYIDFSKNPLMLGSIYCESNPVGAEIFINDSSTGKLTPSTLNNILPGNYEIRYNLRNYQGASLNVLVSSYNKSNIKMTLADTTLWKVFTTNNSSIKTNNLTCLGVDKNDVVWIGTDDHGVISFNGNLWGGSEVTGALPDWHINCVAVDNNNMIFFGTNNGFVTYDGSQVEIYSAGLHGSAPLLPNPTIEAIAFDNLGNWYIGTQGGLMESSITQDGRIWMMFQSVIPDPFITSLFYDNAGNLWVGTHGYGIAKLDINNNWEYFYTGNSSIINNFIRTFTQAPSGDIWVGFGSSVVLGGELATYNGTTWQNSFVIPSSSQTYAILIDKNNTKWVATDQGLVKFNTSSNVINFNYYNTGININNATGLAQDSKGNIWISTYGGGLVEYKGNY